MKFQPAAFLRTTLPLDLSQLSVLDEGRYHSVWLPDHMVSFWPDSIWTPEFTDLATVSHSPHRHLDGLAVAAAVSVLTQHVPIAMSVVDTVRRHPSILAQTAVTISHISKGRFILGLGSGEKENTLPYGFDFRKPVGRFEEALKVIRMLWESEGLIDFKGKFYELHHARFDTELYDGKAPPIWIGASGPRMLDIVGRHADGWWPAGDETPEQYHAKLTTLRRAAEKAGRDPDAIVPAMMYTCLIGDDAERYAMAQKPLVKALILQIRASTLREQGLEHPMGPEWQGFQDIDPGQLPRERLAPILAAITPETVLKVVRNGTPRQIANNLKAYADAGLRVPKLLDYSGMAGLDYAPRSAAKVRETEDEAIRLIDGDV